MNLTTKNPNQLIMKSTKLIPSLLSLLTLVVFTACQSGNQKSDKKMAKQRYTKAIATMHPTAGNEVSGMVTFEKTLDGIKVSGLIQGLSEGEHGFHIHTYGDCSADDATSAGGHFNPKGTDHGAPGDKERHVGDLGNITANADGEATINLVDSTITLNGSHSIIGRAVVIHGGADDFESQPSGAAGPRVACGTVGIAQE